MCALDTLTAQAASCSLAARVWVNPQVCNIFPLNAGLDNSKSPGRASVIFGTTVYPSGSNFLERVPDQGDVDADGLPNYPKANLTTSKFFNLEAPESPGAAPVTRYLSTAQTTPFATNIKYGDDLDKNQARQTYLFVVTPQGVNLEAMENALLPEYIPRIWLRKDDCTAVDPDSDTTCSGNLGKMVTGLLMRTAVNADPGQSSQRIFPVCAVRPKQ
jgi:hypothetical protein